MAVLEHPMVHHGLGSDRTPDFHTAHAPAGALAALVLGRCDADNGPSAEPGRVPAGAGVFAGWRDAGGPLHLLPFFRRGEDQRARYGLDGGPASRRCIPVAELRRDYGWTVDAWSAGDLSLSVRTPLLDLPDPASAPVEDQRRAYCPAVVLELRLVNPGPLPREAVFAIDPAEWWTPLDGLPGLRTAGGFGLACRDAGATWFSAFDVEAELDRRHGTPCFGLGRVGGLRRTVEPGGTVVLTIAAGWWRPAPPRDLPPWYARLFPDVEAVLARALDDAPAQAAACAVREAELAAAALDDEQRFLIAHATRGYLASTRLLDQDGRPRWVVEEGEYRMHNTLDLTVDMAFHELRFHPWTLAAVLDWFAEGWAYRSQVVDPADPGRGHRDAVSFAHDMGVGGLWSAPGRSAYEIDGLDRACFSHMSCEELVNWVLCAGLYWSATGDRAFLGRHRRLLAECLDSLLDRDHPDPARRRGWMQCEDGRCQGGGEITTYDSLDHSLGQARANVYLAVKRWAALLALEALARAGGDPAAADRAADAARLAAGAVAAAADPATGLLPALLDGGNGAAVIPAVEGLIYPWAMGLEDACRPDGPHGALVRTLRRHLAAALGSGGCRYPDGGWRLSASADNTWVSKIILCQQVAGAVLGLAADPADGRCAHRAHADWQRQGAADHGATDQFRSGRPIGSRAYPRLVTADLWLGRPAAGG